MNILSIDWDYFIDADSVQRFSMFPDASTEDIVVGLQAVIWISTYADSAIYKLKNKKQDLLAIGVLDSEIKALYSLVNANKNHFARMSVHESHKEIADILREEPGKPHTVYNIDYHHDNGIVDKEGLHCGNWVRALTKKKIIGDTVWVKHPDSETKSSTGIKTVYTSIKQLHDSLGDVAFDYIFLCRSGMWSPPHLDDAFIDFAYSIADYLDVEEPDGLGTLSYRWTDKMKENISGMAGAIGEFITSRAKISRVQGAEG